MKYVSILYCILYFVSAADADSIENQEKLSDNVLVQQMSENIWIHISETDYPGYGRISANGMVFCDDRFAILADTPWDNNQTSVLCEWIKTKLHRQIRYAVLTHSHQDCMGGIDELKRQGIRTITLDKTRDLCKIQQKSLPDRTFSGRFDLKAGDIHLELVWPGGGHTHDNIVVWSHRENVLFAGCILKSVNTRNLGNTHDADMVNWKSSVLNLKQLYPEPDFIIPGHGTPGRQELYVHTLSLF